MLFGTTGTDEFGFSLNPFHYVKKAAVATEHGVAAGGKFVAHHAVDIAKLSVLPVVELNKYILQPVLHVALTPVRHKVNTLKSRRAKKLAWDRRKSTTPTPQENSEARSWTKSYLKKEVPPFGLMLSLLAGPAPAPLGYAGFGNFGDPTTATIVAAVPTLLAIINKILTRSNNNGEAPANPSGGGKAVAPGGKAVAPGGAPGAPAGGDGAAAPDGGGSDGGAGAGGDDGSGGGGGGGGGGGAKLLGMPKKYVIIGGAVLGGVLVLSLLMPSKKG